MYIYIYEKKKRENIFRSDYLWLNVHPQDTNPMTKWTT